MRKLIVIGIGLMFAGNILAQGTITFANNGLPVDAMHPDRLVRFQGVPGATNGSGVVNLGTSTYVAQLFLASDAGNPLAPSVLVNGPANFRANGSSVPGTWQLVNGTFSSVTAGTTVSLIVRVWDSSLFASYGNALSGGGVIGQSAPFSYFVPNPGAPPGDFQINNFDGFNIMVASVPEPSIFALGALGVMGMMCLRRRKP